jgi:hypothetical protein
VPSRGSQGARAPRSAHATRNVYFQLSGLEDVGFNDFIKNDFIPEGDGQVASGSRECAAAVNIKTLRGRLIANKFSTGWAVGGVKSVEKEKSAVGPAVKYESERYCWTQKLNREDYGLHKYLVLLAVVKE